MKIQKLMSAPAIHCQSTDTLNAAARLLWEHDCGALPVTDSEGKLVGIVTDRDICMAAYTTGRALADIPVVSTMTKQVHSCQAGEPIVVAERLMRDHQVRRIPVVDSENRPIGMLSLNDVARHAASSRKMDGAEHGLTETMAAICALRPSASTPLASTRLPAPIEAAFA